MDSRSCQFDKFLSFRYITAEVPINILIGGVPEWITKSMKSIWRTSSRYVHPANTRMVFIRCSKRTEKPLSGYLFAHPVMKFLI
jgi:hypothetical protein